MRVPARRVPFRCLPASRRPACARRGVVVLQALAGLVVCLLLAGMATQWAYAVLAARSLRQRADALALAAAPSLLDEDFLRTGTNAPEDDLLEAHDELDRFRRLSNQFGPGQLSIPAAEVEMKAAFVSNPGASRSELIFFDRPPYNSVQVTAGYPTAGRNPLAWLPGVAAAGKVDPTATATAALDNWVVGFRPETERPAPVVPLAIDLLAWSRGRTGDRHPAGGNGISELVLRLPLVSADGSGANGALIAFSGTLNAAAAVQQLGRGIIPSDLPVGMAEFGPVSPKSAPFVLRGTQRLADGFASQLVVQIQSVIAQDADTRRVFLLYDARDRLSAPAAGRFRILSFVAGRICGAAITDQALEITIEPCFLIHPTAWTDPSGGIRNLYIHKLRLIE